MQCKVSVPSLQRAERCAVCTSPAAPRRAPGLGRWGKALSRAGHTGPGPDPLGPSGASCAGSSPPPWLTRACGWPSPAEASSHSHPPAVGKQNTH